MNGFKTISSIFDDAIYNLFGFPFEDIFNDDSAANYSYQKKSIKVNGDTYVAISKDGEDVKCFKMAKKSKLMKSLQRFMRICVWRIQFL